MKWRKLNFRAVKGTFGSCRFESYGNDRNENWVLHPKRLTDKLVGCAFIQFVSNLIVLNVLKLRFSYQWDFRRDYHVRTNSKTILAGKE